MMQKDFFYYYLRSMRLYYCFVTGMTTLAGTVMAHAFCGHPWGWQDAVVLTVGFLAWGVNQIFSDWCDRQEDSINAPHRPMVSGKLSPKPALILSASLMLIFAAASYFASPWTLLFLAIGGGLNLCYSKLKKIPVLNCLTYSMAITCCALYGYSGTCGVLPGTSCILPFLLILPAHFLMCSFSYYKDKEGDRRSGIRTLQTLYPDRITLPGHWIAGMIYTFAIFHFTKSGEDRLTVIIFTIAAVLLLSKLIFLLEKEKYHPAVCWNCMLCVCWLCNLIIPFFPGTIILAPLSLLIIWLIFRWYPDEKE